MRHARARGYAHARAIATRSAHALTSRTRCSLAEKAARREEKAAKKAAKEAKKAKKPLALDVDDAEPRWVPIDGMWPAYAVDGKGHRGGSGKYVVKIPVEDFGKHFYLGGDVRMMFAAWDQEKLYRLPATQPPSGACVSFELDASPLAGLGRLAMVVDLEVRARA